MDSLALVKALRLRVHRVTDTEIVCFCPLHKDGKERHPSFSVSRKKPVYNCFGGDTEVMTQQGLKKISELSGSFHFLLTRGGIWVKSFVRCFGRQPLHQVVLVRNGVEKVIEATAGHQWLLRCGGNRTRWCCTTVELRKGSRLAFVLPRRFRGRMNPDGVRHGFVFGDGTIRDGACVAYFLGKKDQALRRFFLRYHYRLYGVRGECGGLPYNFKQLPFGASKDYLYGWLAGYFSADGCVDKRGVCSISSANLNNLEFVEASCRELGIGTYRIQRQRRSGFGVLSDIYTMSLVSDSLSAAFFLTQEHRRRFELRKIRNTPSRVGWTVKSVSRKTKIEKVYCAVVPRFHCFALADNLLTGNCMVCNGGSLTWLVHKITGRNLRDSVDYLEQFGGAVLREISFTEYEERFAQEIETVPETFLAPFINVPEPVARKLGFRSDFLRKQGILYDKQEDRTIFTARDVSGRIRGVVGRAMSGEEPSYLFYAGARRYSVLGLDTFRNPKGITPIIVVEGPRDWLRVRECGFPNCVSILGCSISEEQAKQISECASRVIAFLDNDDAGRSGTLRLRQRFEDICMVTHVTWTPKDPKDPEKVHEPKRMKSLLTAPVLKVPSKRSFSHVSPG